MKVELVIFDMDGLMFDTERVYYHAWQQAFKAYGYEITWEIYTQIVARNNRYIEKVLKGIFGECLPYDEIVAKKRVLSNQEVEDKGIVKKEGLLELLAFLEEKGIQKAVATSSQRQKAIHYLELAGVKERFDYIICGCDVEESKPNPEIFLKAAMALEKDPNYCMVLEDSRLGIQAALNAGMYGVFIPDLIQPDDEIKSNAKKIVRHLKEVIHLITI